MLAIHNWSETADFRADQSYWITRYKRQIEKGDKFLQSHLDDYERERKLAASLALRSGARLPISFMHEARLCIGCLILESVEGNRFTGRLYANLKLDIAPTKLERFVKSDNGQVIRQLVAANIKCLKGGPQLPLL